MTTTLTKIIDPDGEVGVTCDYVSLDAWEDALGGTPTGNLPSDDYIAIADCRCSGGTADTAAGASIYGWTTDATRYIKITTTAGYEAIKSGYSTSRYRIETAGTALTIGEDFVIVEKIQVKVTASSGTVAGIATRTGLAATVSRIRIDKCRITGVMSGTAVGYGAFLNENATARGNLIITNSIIENWGTGVKGTYGETMHVYNSVVYGCTTGIRQDSNSYPILTAYNCAVFNNGDDFFPQASSVISYCASDDGDGANDVAESGGGAAWPSDFNAAGSGDFTLLVGSNLVGAALNLYDDAYHAFQDDIDGDDRGGAAAAWDVGPDEYVAAGGGIEVEATSDPLIITENAANINAETNVQAGIDALVVSENAADVNLDVPVTAGVDALVITENAATIKVDTAIQVGTDTLVITGHAAGINAEISFTAGLDALAITEYAADINLNVSTTATLDTLVLTEYAAIVELSGVINVNATLDALIVTEHGATVNAEVSFTTGLDALTITGHAASVSLGIAVSAGVDALAITENVADVNINVFANAGVDTVAVTEYAADIKADISFATTLDAMAITEYSATVNAETDIQATLDILVLAEYAAGVSVGGVPAFMPGQLGLNALGGLYDL